ncbi:hypothetical protein [Pyrobaculum aerophilum]|uniref:Uncharacterized protein n=1 Tax=Pyrobaculum aerophilum TaxID=13773 RepID=A0A832STK3_9CREN|nr:MULTISPECIES: hypothetical protein [Pyrobaculum]MCX8135432.1 hypothetical protein [Pyrobaculum aerophilum]HII47483.1 hypothetical protein [Pyrobaculum aerophilum]
MTLTSWLYVEAKWSDNVNCGGEKERLKEKTLAEAEPEAFYIFAKSFNKKEEGCFDLADLERLIELYKL